ncbi:hypothetical protein TcG_11583, partial [Trypanosoma cruzi]
NHSDLLGWCRSSFSRRSGDTVLECTHRSVIQWAVVQKDVRHRHRGLMPTARAKEKPQDLRWFLACQRHLFLSQRLTINVHRGLVALQHEYHLVFFLRLPGAVPCCCLTFAHRLPLLVAAVRQSHGTIGLSVRQRRSQWRRVPTRSLFDGHRRHKCELVAQKYMTHFITPSVHRPYCPGLNSRHL